MLRIGVFSDTHVGRNTPRVVGDARRAAFRDAFRQAIDIFIDSKVDYVLHAGDLFEKRSMTVEDVAFVKAELYRLSRSSKEKWGKDVRVLSLRGNHDGMPGGCVLEYLTHPAADYFKVIGDGVGETLEHYVDDKVLVVGVGYHPHIRGRLPRAVREISGLLESSGGGLFKISLFHNYVEGVGDVPPHTPEHSTIPLKELERLNVDLVVLGHYHEGFGPLRVGGRLLLAPGATEAVDLGETGPFSVEILEVEDGGDVQARRVQLKPSHKISTRRISPPEPQPLEWFRKEVLRVVEEFYGELEEAGLPGILRVIVSGRVKDSRALMKTITEEELGDIMRAHPRLLYLEVREEVEPAIEEDRGIYTAYREDMLKELFREMGDDPEIPALVEETMMALEEKASEKTGLLRDSDRAMLVDGWVRILLDRASKAPGRLTENDRGSQAKKL